MKMKIEKAIREVAAELDIPVDVCTKAYYAMWEFIKTHAEELPLKEDLTDEEFSRLRPNFNLPSFGKLYVSPQSYRKTKNKFFYIQKLKEKNNGNNIQNQETETPV